MKTPHHTTHSTQVILLLLLMLLANLPAFSQSPNPINLNLTPGGKLENIFDNNGNQYTLKDIVIEPKKHSTENKILFSTLLCSSGVFNLYFEDGSGMEIPNDAGHIARRAVICQVFQDLSNFIDSPLHNSGNSTKINIWVRDLSQLLAMSGTPATNSTLAGIATSFYNYPVGPTTIIGGIVDNEIWKTMHSGVDSFTNVLTTPNSSLSTGNFYHGMMAINFSTITNWNTDLSITTPSNKADLYSVVLHEVTHALGITSLVNHVGESKFGSNNRCFSRFDTFLMNHNHTDRLLNNVGSQSIMCDYSFNSSLNTSILHPGCLINPPISTNFQNSINCPTTIDYVGTETIPTYTPDCYEQPSSFSHFNNQCFSSGTSPYFVMNSGINLGVTRRYLQPEERNALCDLGYSLINEYGNFSQHSYIDYGGENCNGIRVAGTNDGINGQTFSYTGSAGTPIIISGILNNDYCFGNNFSSSTIANLRFESLQDVYQLTSTSLTSPTTSVINSTSNDQFAVTTFTSSVEGIHLLRYVPYDAITGQRGNITYIYVYVNNSSNCAIANSCNLVSNGDFEQFSIKPDFISQIDRACGWKNATIGGTTDYYNRASTVNFVKIPCNYSGSQDSDATVDIGKAYAGLFLSLNDTFSFRENIVTRLSTPLEPNSTYLFSVDVSLAEKNCHLGAVFQAYIGYANNSGDPIIYPGNIGIPISINDPMMRSTAPLSTIGTDNWHTITFTFTTTATAGQNVLYLGGLTNLNPITPTGLTSGGVTGCAISFVGSIGQGSYYYVDNVSLIKIPNNSINLPQQLCRTKTISNLTNFLGSIPQNGIFSGDGVTENNGIFSFDPTTLPTGLTNITYQYTPTNGCSPITLTDTIMVVDLCPVPFISQTYTYFEDNAFIEIKNPSSVEGIAKGNFYLNLYKDNLPTNGFPTSSVELHDFAPNETKVFRVSTSTTPAYACSGTNILPTAFVFDGYTDILTLSTTQDEYSYDNRVDLVGNGNDSWGEKISLVRSGCATTVPRIDSFDYEDWTRFELDELDNTYTETSQTNPVLGRHQQQPLHFDASAWHDVPVNFMSLPDRSRATQVNTPYSTATSGSFECCSLNAANTIDIAQNNYVSVENTIDVQNTGTINVQHEGSLVMVNDSFHGVSGNNLITINSPGQIHTFKTTVGLDAETDYVFWSTPLANIATNNTTNTANMLFPHTPFRLERFYGFTNANYQDIPNFHCPSATAPNCIQTTLYDGNDDNGDDYYVLGATQRNQQLTAGLGYTTWPPKDCNPCNYTVQFTGKPNNGIVSVPVFHNTPSISYANLVGNPYPSAIDLDRLFEVNAGLIDPVAYIWGRAIDDTPNNPGPYPESYTQDSYLIYNPTMMVTSIDPFGNFDFNGDGILASCQSFFVTTTSNAGNLVFNNSMRTNAPNTTFARQSETTLSNKLWLNLLDDKKKKTSQIGIAFLESAVDSYNSKEDVKTFRNNKTTFYSIVNDIDLVINAQSTFTIFKSIPIGITTSNKIGSQLSISIEKKQGVFSNQEIYIYDKVNNTYTDISVGDFTFTVSNNIMDDRFTIVFQKSQVESNSNLLSQIQVVNNKNNITVLSENIKKIKSIEVYDIYTFSINGMEILSLKDVNKTQEKFLIDKNHNILLLIITLEDGTVVHKKISN